MLAMYLAVLDDRSSEEQFIDVYNILSLIMLVVLVIAVHSMNSR